MKCKTGFNHSNIDKPTSVLFYRYVFFRMKETQPNKQDEVKPSKHSSSKEHKQYDLDFELIICDSLVNNGFISSSDGITNTVDILLFLTFWNDSFSVFASINTSKRSYYVMWMEWCILQ